MQTGWKTRIEAASQPTPALPALADASQMIETGLVAGTCVGTPMGWRPVQSLKAGDLVLTFDNGMQPVAQVSSGRLWTSADHCPQELWPLHVPVGALDNVTPLTLLSNACVMLESDLAEELYDDPFAMIPARALNGTRQIRAQAPTEPLEIVTLHFAVDQVLFVNGSALVFCLAHDTHQPALIEDVIFGGAETAYGTLPETEMQAVIDDLQHVIPESRAEEP
ncbi:Hint domain-containing protein [Actibacterium ureilyticum]|uniref:Hint domain-containing protein n=1 Tax=Actibacterium ureilyticum TaxID=1590614 RepID=UPI000BAAE06F|nr:Hint domain-containing protein [Actibacterium ureilyticum]